MTGTADSHCSDGHCSDGRCPDGRCSDERCSDGRCSGSRFEGRAVASLPSSPWIRCFHPKPAASHTLVCFPHAGGSASYYYGLSAALDPDVELLVVQYPGRENRLFEEPAASVAELADGVYGALRPRLRRRPAFFGHSMGGVVAFEVARRLESDGDGGGVPAGDLAPYALVASASSAPSVRTARPAVADSAHGEAEADDAVLARIMGLGGTRTDVGENPELVRLVLPAIRADLRALAAYRVAEGAAVRCPVTVFVADADPDVPPEEAYAWAGHSTAGSSVHVFEGDHFYLGGLPPTFLALLQAAVRHSRPGTSHA
ncbi:thioesterase II family protein [Streptomyces sp. NPDC090127]|uniref:thioesterase II family protein n=1 Tax=Streptomyces sp. NPDC090127 TaxID=3365953 RepID=UPI0038280584